MQANHWIRELTNYEGKYRGNGTSHSDEDFVATMQIRECALGNGLQLDFRAMSGRDHVLHEESSLLAAREDARLCLYNLNSNNSLLLVHPLVETRDSEQGTILIFQYGDLSVKDGFREQVELELREDGSLRYSYSWGLPYEPFRHQSTATLAKL